MSDDRPDTIPEAILHKRTSDEQAREAVEAVWDHFWDPIISRAPGPIGPLVRFGANEVDQIKRELYDFHTLLHEVPKVYAEITGGMISKPLADPQVVIETAREVAQKDFAEDVVDWLHAQLDATEDATAALHIEGIIETFKIEWAGTAE